MFFLYTGRKFFFYEPCDVIRKTNEYRIIFKIMKKFSIFLLFMTLLLLCGCRNATYISPDKESVNFTIDGGEENVSISADGSWSLTESPDWVTIETHDNVLTIKIARNESGTIREGYIELKGKDGVETSIKVTQASNCTHITPAKDKVEFEKEGGTESVAIDTDGMPRVEASEGFSASYANGNLTVTASANEEGSRRGEIKLICDNQSVTIYASQKGNVCPTCGGTGNVKCSNCRGKGYISYMVTASKIAYEGCGKCGGSGYDDEGWFETQGTGIRKGSGKMKCATCGGTGR